MPDAGKYKSKNLYDTLKFISVEGTLGQRVIKTHITTMETMGQSSKRCRSNVNLTTFLPSQRH